MAKGRYNNRGSNRGNGGNGRGGRGGGRGRGRGRGRGNDDPYNSDFTIYDWANNAPKDVTPGSGVNTPSFRGRGRGNSNGFNTPRGGSATPNRGFNSPRGRGRPQYNTSYDDVDPGLGRGRGSPMDRGRGRGAKNMSSKLRAGAPLSKLLYEDRPFLRPIVFVRSVHTATLFEEKEDILKPLAEDVANDEASHVPTAAQVNRVFGTADEEEGEQLEEIDFSEIGRLQAEVDAAAANMVKMKKEVTLVEDKFTGFYIDTNPAPVVSAGFARNSGEALGDEDDEEVIVYVAPHPRVGPVILPAEEPPAELPATSILTGLAPTISSRYEREDAPETTTGLPAPADAAPQTESSHEPHPEDHGERPDGSPTSDIMEVSRIPEAYPDSGKSVTTAMLEDKAPTRLMAEGSCEVTRTVTSEELPEAPATEAATDTDPIIGPASVGNVTFSFKQTTTQKHLRRLHPVRTPRSLIKNRGKARRKPLRSFSSFGASYAEAQLHEEDPRKDERRVGDSDLEWGDGSDADPVEQLSNGIGDMEIDGDIDVEAMISFVKGMSAKGSMTVTMDDIADAERMKEEDEAGENGASGSSADEDSSDEEEDGEVEAIVHKEEEMLIAEGAEVEGSGKEGEEDDDDFSSDEDVDETPHRGFQMRLHRMRENGQGKGKAKQAATPDSDEDDEDLQMELEQTWAEGAEEFIARCQAIANEDLSSDNRARRNLFQSIQNGSIDFDDYEEMVGKPARRNKDKYKDLPEELQAQWELDREKKAENKRMRALQRIEAAADPLSEKKGGKKGMKAMLAAARYDGPEELPNRITDLPSLVQQIRRFLANVGGPSSMSLPPLNKATRKRVHELAGAFNLNSKSKGGGDTRYTTLTKTTKSGFKINERKIGRIMREAGHQWEESSRYDKGNGKNMSLAKHREGEEVGKAAPKIGESNIGFKMLASMGWAEGDRIGLSGGLDVPLVAKMKKTKLGLGASAQ